MSIPHVYEYSLKGVLNGLMSALNGTVGGGMISRGEPDLDPERLHHVPVQVCHECVAIVGDGGPWSPIPGQPVHEGLADL